MLRILRRQTRTIRQLLRTARFTHRLVPLWNIKYAPALLHALRICRRHGFKPDEAFRLGLFAPGSDPAYTRTFASKKEWTEQQLSLNPRSWLFLTRDKAIFYRYCTACRIPVPKLYAIFFANSAGSSADGALLPDRPAWLNFIQSNLPAEFIVKPATGSYSRDVSLYTRTHQAFVDASGLRKSAAQIYDAMLANPKYHAFVIQQRLRNHPELLRLSATQSLQTVRIVTLVEKTGLCRIIHAHFKPIVGGHLVDTFIDGLTGNVEAVVSIDTGKLSPATQITGSAQGIKSIPAHPDTGVPFDGFQIPMWPRICELAIKTAPSFLPIRAIGWDIAVTPQGPVILEANSLWDPPNQHGSVEFLSSQLSREAG